MRFVFYIVLAFFIAGSFFSCRSSETYLAYAGSIDSLSGAIATLESQLRSVNETELTEMNQRYVTYNAFIKQHIHDTLSKVEADELVRFHEAGAQIGVFVGNRKALTERASILKKQLSDLSKNVRLKNTDEQRLREYFSNERTSATEFANAARTELANYVAASRQFKLSLPAVGKIIRKRNNGELPRVIQNPPL